MIYCVNLEKISSINEILEEIYYHDLNDFKWQIIRIKSGFYIRYCGDNYFMPKEFICNLSNNKCISIINTNCIFINTNDFDIFLQVRDNIKNNYTDDIWELIECMFEDRLEDELIY